MVQKKTKEILQKSKFLYVLFIVRKDLRIQAVINFPTVRMISYVIVYKEEVSVEHYFDTSELNPLVNKQ